MVARRAGSKWREEDEALLRRLRDLAWLGPLWSALGGAVEDVPPDRAAGLLESLRGSNDQIDRALQRDPEALAGLLLEPERLPWHAFNAEALHHLALLGDRLIDRSSVDAGVRISLFAWSLLANESTYLEEIARKAAGESEGSDEVANKAVRRALEEPLRRLGRYARELVPIADGKMPSSRTPARAFRELSYLSDPTIAPGGIKGLFSMLSEEERRGIQRLSSQLRDAVTRDACARLSVALEDAFSSDEPEAFLLAIRRARNLWEATTQDTEVETFLALQTSEFAWGLYHEKRYEPLRRFCDLIRDPCYSLSQKVQQDPTMIAFASRCAQLLVFESEMYPEREKDVLELALRICPTHRNARLMMALHLGRSANQRLVRIGPGILGTSVFRRSEVEAAKEELLRARALWPHEEPTLRKAAQALKRLGISLEESP